MKTHKILRGVFLYVIPIGVALCMIAFAAALILGLTMVEAPRQVTETLVYRAQYIAQAFINLAMVVTVSICGALLYTAKGIRTRRGLLITAVVSFACAILMHAMVYGIVIAVPVPYTLLAPEHITLSILYGPDALPFAGSGTLLVYAAGIIIHLFAPQVLLGLAVGIIALRRYVKTPGKPDAQQILRQQHKHPPMTTQASNVVA